MDLDGTEDGEPEEAGAGDVDAAATEPDPDHDPDAVPAGPLGDLGILADLGLSEKDLLTLRTDALVEIADALGAAEVLEAVR